jgi:dipeptidyl aminopeptidase/acylaminoacyl peptidase
MKKLTALLMGVTCCLVTTAQSKRPLQPEDWYRLKTVSSPQVSPDGNWVLYQLRSIDSAKDRSVSDLWITSWDGKDSWQLTYDPSGESAAKWSPDGQYITFLAKRGTDANSQVYALPTRGGEPKKLTNLKASIADYKWTPDGKKLVLTIDDPSYADTAASKIRKPYVITRYQFKRDREGYLDSTATHLYLYDIATKKLDTLTKGIYSESQPAISPDGTKIAFVSNRTEIPDKNANTAIYLMDLKPGAVPEQLTFWKGGESRPEFSPDGKQIAYLQTSSDEPFTMFGHSILAVVNIADKQTKLLSTKVDRPVHSIRWEENGQAIWGLIEDDRRVQVVRFNLNGDMQTITSGDHSISALERNKARNAWVTLRSTPTVPYEIFTLEGNQLRQLTRHHDEFLANLELPSVEGFVSTSKDGTKVSGILYKPANHTPGTKLPLVIFIHGGPVAQDRFEFDMTRMVYASAGYAVAAVNYRGSSGRGIAYIRSIYGDWGNKEVVDVVGAANHLIAAGIADPNRMGLGGWSYGSITTNYTIATDTRFKAAVSGAGSSLQLSIYGTDQYFVQYENEIGLPWKNKEKWIAMSYPFFKVDKIKTPTLFMASEKDFNVPVAGAEQMYQAFKAVGIPTELVIYPNQYHGISVPSYIVDRLKRHIEWYDKYLK